MIRLPCSPCGHVLVDDALGEPFGDRGLADARLTDQHRVVLGPAQQDLDGAADLFVAADHGVEGAVAGALGEVDAVALERLEARLGGAAVDVPAAAHGLRGLLELVGAGEHGQRVAAPAAERHQQRVGSDELVVPGAGDALGLVEHGTHLAGHVLAVAAADLRQALERGVEGGAQLAEVASGARRDAGGGARVVGEE
jgi:hypothetical protein